jgi:hypothetical protein
MMMEYLVYVTIEQLGNFIVINLCSLGSGGASLIT